MLFFSPGPPIISQKNKSYHAQKRPQPQIIPQKYKKKQVILKNTNATTNHTTKKATKPQVIPQKPLIKPQAQVIPQKTQTRPQIIPQKTSHTTKKTQSQPQIIPQKQQQKTQSYHKKHKNAHKFYPKNTKKSQIIPQTCNNAYHKK